MTRATPQFAHPAGVLEPGHEIPLPATRESPPPLPAVDDIVEGLPSPLPGLVTNNSLPDNQEGPPPVPDPDEYPPLPGPGLDKDTWPLDSDEGNDPQPLDSDEEENPQPPGSDGDEDLPPPDPAEDDIHLTLERVKTDQKFIEMAKAATLESQFSPGELLALQNPQNDQFSPSDDQDLHLSINFYISSLDHIQSQKAYAKSHENILKHFPGSKMLSYNQVKRWVSILSGIVTWKHDMCFNSCVGFTGPFSEMADCPYCSEPRYDQHKLVKTKKKVPRKVFTTFALGPQVQARW